MPSAVLVQNLMQQTTELRLEEQLGSELVASLADPQGAEFRLVNINPPAQNFEINNFQKTAGSN